MSTVAFLGGAPRAVAKAEKQIGKTPKPDWAKVNSMKISETQLWRRNIEIFTNLASSSLAYLSAIRLLG